MQPKTRTLLLVAAALSTQLMASGCVFGGGISVLAGLGDFFSSFFGGSENGGDNGLLGNYYESDESKEPEGNQNNPPAGNSETIIVPGVAVLHNPEPGSLILFGSGLAGLSIIRRRKSRKNK